MHLHTAIACIAAIQITDAARLGRSPIVYPRQGSAMSLAPSASPSYFSYTVGYMSNGVPGQGSTTVCMHLHTLLKLLLPSEEIIVEGKF